VASYLLAHGLDELVQNCQMSAAAATPKQDPLRLEPGPLGSQAIAQPPGQADQRGSAKSPKKREPKNKNFAWISCSILVKLKGETLADQGAGFFICSVI
jgi:hypothetical protein